MQLYEVREVRVHSDLPGLQWILSVSVGENDFESVVNSSSEGRVVSTLLKQVLSNHVLQSACILYLKCIRAQPGMQKFLL